MTRRRWSWLAGWAVLTLLVVLAFQGIAWREAAAAVRGADPAWLLAAVAFNAAILPLAATEWNAFLARGVRVPFRRMLWIHMVTSTVSNGGPFLAGHATGVHLLATRGRTGHAVAVSVKALEQLAEGLAKLTLVGATLVVVPLPPAMRAASLVLVTGVPVLALGVLVAAHRAHVLERWAEDRAGRIGGALRFATEVARQLESVRRPAAFVRGAALAVAQKVAEAAGIWAVVHALGVEAPPWAVLLALTAVNLSTMASVTPANVGIYEGSALLAWNLAGIPPETGLGLALVQHVAYLVPMAGCGWAALAVSGLRPRDLTGPAAPGPETAPPPDPPRGAGPSGAPGGR